MKTTQNDILLLKLEVLQVKIQQAVRSLLDMNEAIDATKKTLENEDNKE
jgi:hypothetical protein